MTSDRFASAQARDLAAELGIDPETIAGTGRDGLIRLVDVRGLIPEPPDSLGEAGRALYAEIRRDWKLRPDEDRLLLAACRTCDELERLEAALDAADPVVAGSKGQDVAHPLIAEVRAHRLALKQLLGSLGIREASQADPADDEPADGTARSHAGRQLARQRWGRRG